MMKFEPHLFWIAVQDLFYEWMICTATWTLIIAEFHERHFCAFGSAEVSTTFEFLVERSRLCFGNFVGSVAQKHSRSGRNANGQDDDYERLHDLRHARHSSAAMEKKLAKSRARDENFPRLNIP